MEKLIGELLAKAKKATSAEELLALAKENGISLSEEEAAAYFKEMNHVDEQPGSLSDASLEQVAGGCSTVRNTNLTERELWKKIQQEGRFAGYE